MTTKTPLTTYLNHNNFAPEMFDRWCERRARGLWHETVGKGFLTWDSPLAFGFVPGLGQGEWIEQRPTGKLYMN